MVSLEQTNHRTGKESHLVTRISETRGFSYGQSSLTESTISFLAIEARRLCALLLFVVPWSSREPSVADS